MSERLRPWLPLLLLAAGVMLVRALLIGGFGNAMPFWDQWDGEAATWLKPWVEGELSVGHLWAAHNEHRIAYSRLWSLLWFEANGGHWDNMVLALANTLLSATLAVLLYVLLRDGLVTRTGRGVLYVLVLLLAVLPFGWENLLVGFQSQFQFMALFALLLLAATARLRDRPASIALIWSLALLGLPTMATGVLAPVAAGGLLVLRLWAGQWRAVPAVVTVLGLAAIAIAGYAAVPVVPGHQGLHPESLAEGWRVFGRVLAWPMPQGWWVVPALWLPTALFLWRLAFRRRATPGEWLAIGLAGWVLLQAFAITWSRGQGLLMPASRYTDLLAFGLAANAFLALSAWEHARLPSESVTQWRRRGATGVLVLCVLAIAAGLGRGVPLHRDALFERRWYSEEQSTNVREFLATGDAQALVVPFFYIPYPQPDPLVRHLSDPSIRAMLPATLTDGSAGPLGRLAGRWRDTVRPVFGSGPPVHPANTRRWRLPVADGPQEALQVVAGVELTLAFRAPRSARLASVGLQLGDYGRTLPGSLELQACSGGECVHASAPLAAALDNTDFVLVFEQPLPVRARDVVRLSVGASDTGFPAVVWLVPAVGDARRMRVLTIEGLREDLAGHRPRLVLGLLDEPGDAQRSDAPVSK